MQEEKFGITTKYRLDMGRNGMSLRWFRFLNSLWPTPCDFYSDLTQSNERHTLWYEMRSHQIVHLLSDYPSGYQ